MTASPEHQGLQRRDHDVQQDRPEERTRGGERHRGANAPTIGGNVTRLGATVAIDGSRVHRRP